MYLSVELFLLFLVFFIVGLSFYISGDFFIVEWIIGDISSQGFSYELVFDSWGCLFVSMIFFISFLICVYSYWYVGEYLIRFYYLMLLFILSMFLLVMSPNFISMLLGWDGLGIISFLLVLFYYNNLESINNSLVTLLFNRLGDSLLLVSLGLIISGGGNGSLDNYMGVVGLFTMIMLSFGLVTKSAQFPFMSWLPKAMSAPTPVSSLVHSSTLVTAGVYMLIRFDSYILGSGLFMFISLVTMFLSGIVALFEMDLKKIIANSTLSQLGLMVFGLVMGFNEMVYFHMLMHAIFKSMMFMSAGVMIHELGGIQDIRCYGGCFDFFSISSLCMLGGSFSLSGMYFLSGFYSKDGMIECILEWGVGSLIILIMYYFSGVLTILYCWRILSYLFFNNSYIFVYLSCEDSFMSMVMLMLFIGSVFCGWGFSMMFLEFEVLIYVNIFIKLIVLLIIMMIFLYYIPGYLGSELMFDLYIYFKYVFINFFGDFMYFDKFWLEIYGGGMIIKSFHKCIYLVKDYSFVVMIMVISLVLFIFSV